jgi:hypothetical protein
VTENHTDYPIVRVELRNSERQYLAKLITREFQAQVREEPTEQLAMLVELGRKFGASVR